MELVEPLLELGLRQGVFQTLETGVAELVQGLENLLRVVLIGRPDLEGLNCRIRRRRLLDELSVGVCGSSESALLQFCLAEDAGGALEGLTGPRDTLPHHLPGRVRLGHGEGATEARGANLFLRYARRTLRHCLIH